jgi:hypothetical protein
MTLGGLCGNVMILSHMPSRFLAVLLAVAPLTALAQDPLDGLPPGVLLLSRIKRHMREDLARLPDYTCLQTAQRFYKQPAAKAVLKPIDTQRLEVLDAGDKELYAPPGARNFQKENPGEFTTTGLSGTGVFSLALRNLMVNDNGLFQFRGEEPLAGRRAVRYDYRVPLLQSGMTIEVGGVQGRVASKGSVWVDPDSLDLLRLDIVADDVPPNLPLVSSISSVYYARMPIGDRTILLPETAQMDLVETSGAEARNVVEFTHCRAFQAESTVNFGSPTGLPPSDAPAEMLPAGVSIAVTLSAPITGAEPAGTLIEGRVAGNVGGKPGVLVRDGAIVHGRIRRLEPPVLAVEFTEIEAGGISMRFLAELQTVDGPAAVERPTGADLPGVGTMTIPRFPVPAGFRMVWRTRAL